jgi:hypothetical protein
VSASYLQTISPDYIRTAVIVLSPKNPLVPVRAFQAVDIIVTPTGLALEAGLSLPLDLIITAPSSARIGSPLRRHAFRRVVPTVVSFVPREGGPHLVVLRERNHNLFWGSLTLDVQGERLTQ